MASETRQIAVFGTSKSEWGTWTSEGREVRASGERRLWVRNRSRRLKILRGRAGRGRSSDTPDSGEVDSK